MFTNDIIIHHFGKSRFNDKQIIWLARGFIVLIVLATYLLSLAEPRRVFTLGGWCFSGFAALFPIIFAALYWKRTTEIGVMVSIITTAISWFVLFKQSNFGANPKFLIHTMMPVTVMIVVSILSLVLTSLFTTPPKQETLDRFF